MKCLMETEREHHKLVIVYIAARKFVLMLLLD